MIPKDMRYHNPNIIDKTEMTVALHLAKKGVIPPKEWHHNPEL